LHEHSYKKNVNCFDKEFCAFVPIIYKDLALSWSMYLW